MTNIALVNDATHERINKGREDSHTNILPRNRLWLWALIKILYAKIVDVGQGRQLNDLCLFIFTRSHIVIDPLTCGACPLSLLAKNSALSRDTTCASKNP